MRPILHLETETKFDTNGIGILGDCASCIVTEERNGSVELEMQYPISGIHYDKIALRSIILAKPNPEAAPEPFRVYEISRPLRGIITVYARHLAYDLAGIVDSPFTASTASGAMAALKSNATSDCPFDFWTDKTTSSSMTVQVPSTIWGLLGGSAGGILDVYGGEYEFNRYTVKLHNARGKNRGVAIRYGKNLTALEQDENCASVYTGIYPYWRSSEGELVQLPEKIVYASGTYPFTRIAPVDFSGEWEEAPTESALRARAETYVKANNIGVPKVSLTVSFVDLAQAEEYKDTAFLERVSLCDTVTVIFPALSVETTAKCVKTTYNVLLDRMESVELGDGKETITKTVATQKKKTEQQQTEIEQKPSVSTVKTLVAGGASAAVTEYDERLTQKAIFDKLTNNGETQGIFLQDGKLYINGTYLVTGILSDKKGNNYWNLDTGAFQLASTTTIGGLTAEAIAEDAANTIVSEGIDNYDDYLTQRVVFNKLTNNGQTQGIYLSGGKLYVNADYINAGTLDADYINMDGKFYVYSGSTLGGYVGFMYGSDGVSTTRGVGVSDTTGRNYVVATTGGVRLQTGGIRLYLDGDDVVVDGDLKVSGDIVATGAVTGSNITS